MMKYKEIVSHLQKGEYAPAYLLCGTEPYYIDKVSDWMEANLLDEASKAFDQIIVYGKDLKDDISMAVDMARGMPMMGGKKLVMVKEAQMVKKWEALGLYMQHPQPNSIFVICYKYGKPDQRLSVWKEFEKRGGVMMQSDKLRDYQIEPLIRELMEESIAKKGLSIRFDPKVPSLLAAYIGNELVTIMGAVDKLVAGLPEGQTVIDAAMVERNIGISKDYNVFELQDALIRGDITKANRITQYFVQSKDHPMIKELGVLFNFFANLMIYHYLPDKTDRVVAPSLGVSPFFVKDYAAAARRYNQGKTFRIIGYFRDIDARLKGLNNPSAKEADLWKELIYKITH